MTKPTKWLCTQRRLRSASRGNSFCWFVMSWLISVQFYLSQCMTKHKMTCVHNDNSDQPMQPRSVIRVFVSTWRCFRSLAIHRRLWSDCTDRQAGLSLPWAHVMLQILLHSGSYQKFSIIVSESATHQCYIFIQQLMWDWPRVTVIPETLN